MQIISTHTVRSSPASIQMHSCRRGTPRDGICGHEGAVVTVASVISAVLGNLELVFIIVAILTTAFKLRRAKAHHTVMTASYTLWGELVFYAIGFGFLWAFVFHAFVQQI